MSTSALPLILTAIEVVKPFLPSLILTVEHLFGHSSVSGVKNGPSKLNTVTSIAKTLLTDLANAGVIPSAPVIDPALDGSLGQTVQDTVNNMKTSGLLNPPSVEGLNPSPADILTKTGLVTQNSETGKSTTRQIILTIPY